MSRQSRTALGIQIKKEIYQIFSDVQEFTPVHLRLYGVVDVWPTTRRWWSPVLGRKGFFSRTAELIDIVDLAQRNKKD